MGGSYSWSVLAGVVAVILWLGVIVTVIGKLAFAGQRRALRRGTHPVHLLPWYLGGTPEVTADPPQEDHRTKARHS